MSGNKLKPTAGVAKKANAWENVDIYWSNDKKDDFNLSHAFPSVRRMEGATVLEKKVFFTPYEPNKVNQSGVESINDLISKQKENFKATLEKARKDNYEMVCIAEDDLTNPAGYKQHCSLEEQKQIHKRKSGKQIKMKRAGMIADAVTQNVIVKITMKTEITSAAQLPKLTTWAFLQPPSIGRNKKRVNANNGYVVDDAQKSGWFLATIDGTQAKPNGQDKYTAKLIVQRDALVVEGDKQKRESKLEEFPASIKVDGKDAYFKYTVIVRNDQTEDDFKQKRDKFKKSKKINDILTIECGSYLKIWVRNSEFTWSGGNPADEYTEALRESMDKDDPQTDANKPQEARNHTWKRDKLVSGEGEDELLYVGLYPTTIINKINELEKIVQPKQPEAEETNFGVWLAVTVGFSIVSYALHNIKLRSAKKKHAKDPSKSLAEHEKEVGKKILRILQMVSAHEVVAAFAVGGFKDKQDVEALLKRVDAPSLKKMWEITTYIYNQLLEFSLAKDEQSEKEHVEEIEKEDNEVRARHLANEISKEPLAKRLSSRVKNTDGVKGTVKDLAQSFTLGKGSMQSGKMNADLMSLETAKAFPAPIGSPLPIPFLQWIIWYIEVQLKGKLELLVEGEYKDQAEDKAKNQTAENKAKLKLGLNGSSELSLTFNLQAAWTAYIDQSNKDYRTKGKDSLAHDFKWGTILQDVFEAVECHIFVGCGISTALGGDVEFEYDFNKKDDPFSTNLGASGNLKFNAPVGAQISVFSWGYDMAEVTMFNMTKAEASLFEYVRLFEMEMTGLKEVIRWGDGEFSEYCYLIDNKKQRFNLGEDIPVFLAYKGVKDPEISGVLGFRRAGKTGAESRVELKKWDKDAATHEKLSFKDGEGKNYSHKAIFKSKILIHSEDPKDKKSSVILSSPDSSTISFCKYVHEETRVALDYIYLKEKDALNSFLDEEEQIQIDLPKLTKLEALSRPSVDFSQPLIFGATINNFEQDYVWVRVREKEMLFDRTFKYKQQGESRHREWNLFKLRGDQGSRRYIDIDMRRLLSIKDLGYFEGEIRLYLEFAYYADNQGDEYLIHQEDASIETADFSEKIIANI